MRGGQAAGMMGAGSGGCWRPMGVTANEGLREMGVTARVTRALLLHPPKVRRGPGGPAPLAPGQRVSRLPPAWHCPRGVVPGCGHSDLRLGRGRCLGPLCGRPWQPGSHGGDTVLPRCSHRPPSVLAFVACRWHLRRGQNLASLGRKQTPHRQLSLFSVPLQAAVLFLCCFSGSSPC